MRAAEGIDQLPGDAHPRSRFANRALENIAHAELAPDLLHIDRLALVGKARIVGDDEEPADPRQRGERCRAGAADAQRPGDVFEALLANVGELGLDFAAHLTKSVFGDADAAGFGDAFEPRRDVDAVAEDVVSLDQYVAEMDADAPFHAALAGNPRIAFRRQLLQDQGA